MIEKCPVQTLLEMLGGKWKLLIIYHLKEEKVLRFLELKRKISIISEKMLTKGLKELEINGFIIRKDFGQIPPKVEYRLTKKGNSLYPILDSLDIWASKNIKPEK